jgi:hypothetical protein
VNLTAPGKLLALCVIIAGCFAFIIVSLVQDHGADTTPAWATLTLVTGYLIGNGAGALRGTPQAPVFAPKDPPDA